jgi:predicted PurR-regulated permease PerM
MNRPTWSSQVKLLVVGLILAGLIYLLTRFSVAIPSLILGCILAFILTPAVNNLQHRLHINRWLAIVLVFVLLLLIIVGLLMILIPLFIHQVRLIDFDLQAWLLSLRNLLSGQVLIFGQVINLNIIFDRLSGSLQGLVQPIVGQTIDILAGFISSLVWIVFTLVVSIYLIKDSAALSNYLEGIVPPGYKEDYLRLRDEINLIWSAFFRGQLMLAGVVAVIQTAVCLALGLRFGVFFGLLAGLLEFVPSLGHTLWFILTGLNALIGGSSWIPLHNWVILLILAGIDFIFTQFDMNYLIPRIVGRRVRLPPLVVIIGIVAGATVAGVLGVVLASPTIASFRVIGRYIYARLFNLEPFPENASSSPLPVPELLWWQRRTSRHARGKVSSPEAVQAANRGQGQQVDKVEVPDE